MKGKRIALAICVVILITAGLLLAPVIIRRPSVDTSAASMAPPTTAFELKDGMLPSGWSIASRSTEYLNLASTNGCFTTSVLTVLDDYKNISSIDAFKASFVPKFTAKGYTIDAIATHNLDVTTSAGRTPVNAIYYELTQTDATSFHVDGGVKGAKNTAFMSVACSAKDRLADAQSALLAVTYNGSYVPLSGASKN